MGSNQNRYGDKKSREWGSKARKEEAHRRKATKRDFAVEDNIKSNVVKGRAEMGYQMEQSFLEEIATGDGVLAPSHLIGYYVPRPSPKRRKKDTKRWCRGRVGQEHDWPEEPNRVRKTFKTFRCGRCGKERTKR